ncbi:MAG: zinc-ribbon domain-containing protein [Clostridia bacterium]|nr:zinc-ribbon domain-containing protein [Clostridia bacterium]
MYCKNCGSLIDDKAVVCPHCGVPVDDNFMRAQQPVKGNSGLVTAAKVFIILSFIAWGITLLVLLSLACAAISFLGEGATDEDTVVAVTFIIYFIFAIILGAIGIFFGVKVLKKIKAQKKPSVAVCVCSLIFTNVIAGILLLCTKEEDYIKTVQE